MQLIFLHGLGQNQKVWQPVIQALPNYQTITVNLFADEGLPTDFYQIENRLKQELEQKKDQDIILIGLSLGAVLALAMLKYNLPNLKGLVLIAGQYKLKSNCFYQLQRLIFKVMPAFILKKQGMDKKGLNSFYSSLSDFDLSRELTETKLPVQIICGEKDTFNLPAAKAMSALPEDADLALIPQGGHELNRDCPEELAVIIRKFLKQIKESGTVD
ncbi:alpha/beta fold hydrolase [Streptococcus pantholopis]|uniref:alpha/beta fold hydrolase n=1 Tax=Streptococcus pantholopis TaxID=1811193 RepID=UPI00082AD47F|nr:alpha/beta hydrolase [Streptococcus pantholopis]